MDEKRAAFNAQMNEWVSRQGLWFQLRHAAADQSLFSRVARLVVRVVIVLILCAVVFFVYLLKRVGTEGFHDEVQQGLEKSLRGKDSKLGLIQRDRDAANISFIEMDGLDSAFFHHLDARLIRFNMTLTDGLFGDWNGGGINIDRMDLDLRAGARDDASAAKAYEALFIESSSFRFEWIDVEKASLNWGYSANNRGSIRDSHMIAIQDGDGWRMEFKGGTFNQNWLRQLEIGKIVVIANQQGVHIKEAQLLSGGGSFSFQADVGSGGQPEVVGTVELDSFPVKSLLPFRFHEWIEGEISGEGKVTGSTNSQQGIIFDLDLSLEDGDVLVLRDTLPLLSALTVVDVYNSYRKILFADGGCHIRTNGGEFHVDHLDFKAGDLFHLGGGFDVRPPTHKEIATALNIEDVQSVTDIIEKNWKLEDELLELDDSTVAFGKRKKASVKVISDNRRSDAFSKLSVEETSVLTEKHVLRYDGAVKVGLKRDAFDKSPALQKAYPQDEATGRIWIDVPMSGRFETLTLLQAKRLYLLGRDRK